MNEYRKRILQHKVNSHFEINKLIINEWISEKSKFSLSLVLIYIQISTIPRDKEINNLISEIFEEYPW